MFRSRTASAQDQKTPMLLLHGFMGCPEMWEPVIDKLTDDHEVAAIALPGHHNGPPIPEGVNPLQAGIDVIEKMMDERGWDRAHIVGNSLGGWIAILLAVRGRALSVTAFAPGGGWEPGDGAVERLVWIFRRMHWMLKLSYPMALITAVLRPLRWIAWNDIAHRPARLGALLGARMMHAANNCPAYHELTAIRHEIGTAEVLPTPRCPVRIVWCEKDTLMPRRLYGAHWEKCMPSARVSDLPGAGHVPMIDCPTGVAEVVLEMTRSIDRGPAGVFLEAFKARHRNFKEFWSYAASLSEASLAAQTAAVEAPAKPRRKSTKPKAAKGTPKRKAASKPKVTEARSAFETFWAEAGALSARHHAAAANPA